MDALDEYLFRSTDAIKQSPTDEEHSRILVGPKEQQNKLCGDEHPNCHPTLCICIIGVTKCVAGNTTTTVKQSGKPLRGKAFSPSSFEIRTT